MEGRYSRMGSSDMGRSESKLAMSTLKDVGNDNNLKLKINPKYLEIANNELPIVQAKYEGLRREVDLLESKKESLEKEIFGLHATLVQYRTSYQEESALIDTMHQERLEPKESVREFENDNEEYINDKERGSNEVENAH